MTIQFSQALEGFKRFQSFRANRWSPDLKPNIGDLQRLPGFFTEAKGLARVTYEKHWNA
jgi:hypothetical protein